MELREKVVETLWEHPRTSYESLQAAADRILDIPEIREALAAYQSDDVELPRETIEKIGIVYGHPPKTIRVTDD